MVTMAPTMAIITVPTTMVALTLGDDDLHGAR